MRFLLFAVFSLCGMASRAAVVDLGSMELGKEYELKAFNKFYGTFTAPTSGWLTIASQCGNVLDPYHARYETDEEMMADGNPIEFTIVTLYPRAIEFPVEAGKTYVLYKDFVMDNDVVVLSMDDGSLTYTVKPQEGTVYSITTGRGIELTFNKAIEELHTAVIATGDFTAELEANVVSTFLMTDPKNQLYNWLTMDVIKPGDTFTVTFENVRSTNGILYNGDGRLVLTYTMSEMPVQLVGISGADGKILSYFSPKKEEGLIALQFDDEVSEGFAELRFGVTEGAEGEYYVEQLPVTASGNTLYVDLRGKVRRPVDMVRSATNYDNFFILVYNVKDGKGELTYSPGQGTVASYGIDFTYRYQEIRVELAYEFMPVEEGADGQRYLPLWLDAYKQFTMEGARFTYNGIDEEVAYDRFVVEPDNENPGAATIKIPLSASAVGDVQFTFVGLECADGGDYTQQLVSTFTLLTTSIEAPLQPAEPGLVTVYTLQGRRLLDAAPRKALEQLPAGLYIVNGEKVTKR